MTPDEFDQYLDDLETRLERLRSLYEQYFMGMERIEPSVARKDVDRRFWMLRREKVRNTARRFKLQTLVQRYNTLQQYWHRTCREIDQGTYRRHRLKAERAYATATNSAAPTTPPPEPNEAAERSRQATRSAEEDLRALLASDFDPAAEVDAALDAIFGGPAPPKAPAPPSKAGEAHTSPTKAPSGAPARSSAASGPTAPPTKLSQVPGSSLPGSSLPGSSLPGPSVPGPAPRVTAPPGPPPRRPPGAPSVPSPGRLSGVAPPRAPMSSAPTGPTPTGPDGRALPPGRAVPGTVGSATPPLRGSLVPSTPSRPAPPPRPAPPNSAAPTPATPSVPAPRPTAPRPTAPRPPVPSPPRASPRGTSGENSLSEARIRELHQRYLAARQGGAAPPMSIDKLAQSLRATEQKLRQQHRGRQIDFDIVMRDGKPVIKPKLS